MVDSNEFWSKWEETKAELLPTISKAKVRQYYDYFSRKEHELFAAKEETMLVAAAERIQLLNSEIQQRRPRWDVRISALTLLAGIVFGALGEYHASRLSASRQLGDIRVSPHPHLQ